MRRPSAKNACVVYSGKVGAKMRPKPHRIVRPKPKKVRVHMLGGPLGGLHGLFDYETNRTGTTLPIVVKGQRGQYVNGIWEPVLD